jgi:hypothetical protein
MSTEHMWPIPGSGVSITTGGTSASAAFPAGLLAKADYVVVSAETEDAYWRTGKGSATALATDPFAIKSPTPPQAYLIREGHDTIAAKSVSGSAGVFRAWLANKRV